MIKVYIVVISILVFLAGIVLAHLFLRKARGKKHYFSRVLIYIYAPLVLWSAAYFVVCLIYAGIRLSLIWIWPVLALFGTMRMIMLRSEIMEHPILRIPKWLRYAYRALFAAGVITFLILESLIVDAMTALPPSGLEYVIVLGAGLNGTEPTNPLRVRIEKGAEYMKANPETILIASGGKGEYEQISEAECIRRQLVEVYGIPDERILLEDRSADTEENLRNSLKLIGRRDASVGIITNGFHEYRAMLIAEHTGFENAETVPATTLLPVGIHYIVREFFGVMEFLVKYHLK